MSNIKYATVKGKFSNLDAIKLLEYPYENVIFSYGKVSLEPDEANDKLILQFEYDIHDYADKGFDESIFENYIGDLLKELIQEGVKENTLTYTGGVDED